MDNTLFSGKPLASVLDAQVDHIRQIVEAGDYDHMIRNNPLDIVETLRAQHTLERVQIKSEIAGQRQTIKNKLLCVSFRVPFTGDSRLLEGTVNLLCDGNGC